MSIHLPILRRASPGETQSGQMDEIPGLADVSGVEGTRLDFHRGALHVLERQRGEGRPFALFLRNFRLLQLHGPEDDPRLLDNLVRRSLWERGQLNAVRPNHRRYG